MRDLKLPRFYRYVIYRFYTWRLNRKDDTPVLTVILGMSFIHLLQMFMLFALIAKIYDPIIVVFKQQKGFVYSFLLVFALSYFFIFYNKKRWQGYIEEFKDETSNERKHNGKKVWLFTVGFIFLFFLVIPILFWNGV